MQSARAIGFVPERTYPVIIPSIHIPLDIIARSLGSERLESMSLGDLRSFVVREFLVFFVMSMIGIDLCSVSRCHFW